jgi:hypothetical protein
MRLARIATAPLALAALAALSCSKSETSSTPPTNLGAISCSSADQSVCPPSSLTTGFNGSSGTPSITPTETRTSFSTDSSNFVIAGATSSSQAGYWFDVVGGTLRAWGQIGVGISGVRAAARTGGSVVEASTPFYAEIPLFCGQQTLVYRFDNGSGHSYWGSVVTLTNCSTAQFRAQLTWDTGPTGSDIDLHLIRPGGTMFDDVGLTDCYYYTCKHALVPQGLDWGAAGAAGNPSLDVDNVEGYGPENITITSGAETGNFPVIIDNYDDVLSTHATVKLYFNDVEVARYTSDVLDYSANHEFWYVANVNIVNQTVTPVNTYSASQPLLLAGARQAVKTAK